MDKILKKEIDTMITGRILGYHSLLIETGQIQAVELKGPSATPPLSHCNQSEHMQKGEPSEGLVPLSSDPTQSNSGGHEHE